MSFLNELFGIKSGGGKTRSGKKYGRTMRKQRSNKGVKRGPRSGKTRSGRRFRVSVNSNKRVRKQRSNKGIKRGSYGPRTGITRSGRKFKKAYGESNSEGIPYNESNNTNHNNTNHNNTPPPPTGWWDRWMSLLNMQREQKKRQPKLYAPLPDGVWSKKDVKRYIMQQSPAGISAEFDVGEEEHDTVMLIPNHLDEWTDVHKIVFEEHGWEVTENDEENYWLMKI